ncbi:uncharacterized protein SCHCODRAFT_02261465 [Schizophyllum commune H4-8]|uniref:uncharacterized protein n=1 Tax=Schizophyllum commune (strain H4-8 / FGSC 9210) TaxID=578458 RepID=UPI00215EB94E|nr:uncharacterized protein SCHCODRAFT_02261465 [Schizophyllum commune H4-8]KAI5893805.1 hypothetical protein SCHCODRAFT_02261465 [Schizophyllum commune H4-8]
MKRRLPNPLSDPGHFLQVNTHLGRTTSTFLVPARSVLPAVGTLCSLAPSSGPEQWPSAVQKPTPHQRSKDRSSFRPGQPPYLAIVFVRSTCLSLHSPPPMYKENSCLIIGHHCSTKSGIAAMTLPAMRRVSFHNTFSNMLYTNDLTSFPTTTA